MYVYIYVLNRRVYMYLMYMHIHICIYLCDQLAKKETVNLKGSKEG